MTAPSRKPPMPEDMYHALVGAGLGSNPEVIAWLNLNPLMRVPALQEWRGFIFAFMRNPRLADMVDRGEPFARQLKTMMRGAFPHGPTPATIHTLAQVPPTQITVTANGLPHPTLWRCLNLLRQDFHADVPAQWTGFTRTIDFANAIETACHGPNAQTDRALGIFRNLTCNGLVKWDDFHLTGGNARNGSAGDVVRHAMDDLITPLATAYAARLLDGRHQPAVPTQNIQAVGVAAARRIARRISPSGWLKSATWLSSGKIHYPANSWLRMHELPYDATGAQFPSLLPACSQLGPLRPNGVPEWQVDIVPIDNGPALLDFAGFFRNCIAAETPSFLHPTVGGYDTLLILRSHTAHYPPAPRGASPRHPLDLILESLGTPGNRYEDISIADIGLEEKYAGELTVRQHCTVRNKYAPSPSHAAALADYMGYVTASPRALRFQRNAMWEKVGALPPLQGIGAVLGFNPHDPDQFDHLVRSVGHRLTATSLCGHSTEEILKHFHVPELVRESIPPLHGPEGGYLTR